MRPLHPKAAALLAREQWEQRTPAWYAVRKRLLTASDVASALDIPPYPSYRGSSRAELLGRKRARTAFSSNMFTAHGQKYEDEARGLLEAALSERVEDVGLVKHASLDWLGASPDGVTHSGKLVEIKCPLKREIVPGHVPHHYWPQIQVQMECCDVDQTLFVQYKPGGLTPDGRPLLTVCPIDRDRAWFERHREELHAFWREACGDSGGGDDEECGGDGQPACLIDDGLYADMYAAAAADPAAAGPEEAAAAPGPAEPPRNRL